MKKLIVVLSIGAALTLLVAHDSLLWSALEWLNSPRMHEIQRGESLSKLAQQHYGDASYWRELALVNRAPAPDHIEVGERMLLPSVAAIQQLRRAYTMTSVNGIAGDQELAARLETLSEDEAAAFTDVTPTASDSPAPAAAATSTSEPALFAENAEKDAQTQSQVDGAAVSTKGQRSFAWLWIVAGLALLGGAVGLIFYRRNTTGKAESQKRSDADYSHHRRSFALEKTGERKASNLV